MKLSTNMIAVLVLAVLYYLSRKKDSSESVLGDFPITDDGKTPFNQYGDTRTSWEPGDAIS